MRKLRLNTAHALRTTFRMRPLAAPRPSIADVSVPTVGDVCLGAFVQRSSGAETRRDPAP